jgi:hypothetical protein
MSGLSFASFLSEEHLVDVVIQIIGREKPIERAHRHSSNHFWNIAVGIPVNNRDYIPLNLVVRLVIGKFGFREVPTVDNAWIRHLNIDWRLKIYIVTEG